MGSGNYGIERWGQYGQWLNDNRAAERPAVSTRCVPLGTGTTTCAMEDISSQSYGRQEIPWPRPRTIICIKPAVVIKVVLDTPLR